ncbi:MAG: hypothetical protein WA061_02415 [Microgenomates group bacterium]
MLLKLKQINASKDVLNFLTSQKMSGRLAFTFGRNIKRIYPEINRFQTEWDALIMKYGSVIKEKDKPDITKVTPENMDVWMTEAQALSDTEVELNLVMIKSEDLNQLSLTPLEVETISWMIED